MVKRVPNALTVARITVTPILILCLFQDSLLGQGVALSLFAAAAASDYLDGRLARKLKAHSRLGRFLDPMADKVLVLGTFVALAFLRPEIVPWWAVTLIAARDILVTLVRMRAEVRGRSIRTLAAAKLKTLLQLTFLIGMLILLTLNQMTGTPGEIANGIMASTLPLVVLTVVVAFTVATGLWYLLRSELVAAGS